jgi:hypothetical protein
MNKRKTRNAPVHPSSFILHPSSFILVQGNIPGKARPMVSGKPNMRFIF